LKRLRVIAKALETKGGFTKIIRLGADLAPSAEIRATADELRVPNFPNAMG